MNNANWKWVKVFSLATFNENFAMILRTEKMHTKDEKKKILNDIDEFVALNEELWLHR